MSLDLTRNAQPLGVEVGHQEMSQFHFQVHILKIGDYT